MSTMQRLVIAVALALVCVPAARAGAGNAHARGPQWFRVRLGPHVRHAVSGRLLVFVDAVEQDSGKARGRPVRNVYIRSLDSDRNAVAAMHVRHLAPGGSVVMDADTLAFPRPFSRLAPGRYHVQAVLDTDGLSGYRGRDANTLVSTVIRVPLGGHAGVPELVLHANPAPVAKAWKVRPRTPAKQRARRQAMLDAARAHSRAIDFVSPVLSAFWGRTIHMRGWVLLPPGYARHPHRRYPTVYRSQAFTGTLVTLTHRAAVAWKLMASGATPPMIDVFLDESSPTGTHEFADSVNNGPWGTALTTELIPKLESEYRMDARPAGRFLTGHSSGGWAALWLQVRYPRIFGGTWPAAPDPVDFSDFMGPDLYAPHANIYHKPDGAPWPAMRVKGKVYATAEQLAKLERVMAPYGGQDASFEWVFSPRGRDGRPEPLFDRDTGAVDPAVARYWRDHYDIAYRIRTRWKQLKPYLDGKIHLFVGSADTFYLDGPAHRLQAVLDALGAKSDFHFLPGRTHAVYARGKDRYWLDKVIAWQMYKVARPSAKIPEADVLRSGTR